MQMRRPSIVLSAALVALLCVTLMDAMCQVATCPNPQHWWLPVDWSQVRSDVFLFGSFAVLFVAPLALLARAVLPALPATSLSAAACTVLSTSFASASEGTRSGLSIVHYAVPFFVAWTAYAWVVIRFWPREPMSVRPAVWTACVFSILFWFAWKSAPRGTVVPLPVDWVEVTVDALLSFVIAFPLWLSPWIATRWPRVAKVLGMLPIAMGLALLVSEQLQGEPFSVAILYVAAGLSLVGFAHLTARSGRATWLASERLQ